MKFTLEQWDTEDEDWVSVKDYKTLRGATGAGCSRAESYGYFSKDEGIGAQHPWGQARLLAVMEGRGGKFRVVRY